MLQKNRSLLALLAILGSALTSCSPEPDRFSMDIHYISDTEATSPCIGRTDTPRCALDTMLACSVRAQMAMCRKVGLARDRLCLAGGAIKYGVAEEILWREENIPEDVRGYPDYQPGNASVFVVQEFCRRGKPGCFKRFWHPVVYIFRPTDSGYVLQHWYGQADWCFENRASD